MSEQPSKRCLQKDAEKGRLSPSPFYGGDSPITWLWIVAHWLRNRWPAKTSSTISHPFGTFSTMKTRRRQALIPFAAIFRKHNSHMGVFKPTSLPNTPLQFCRASAASAALRVRNAAPRSPPAKTTGPRYSQFVTRIPLGNRG